MDELQYIEETKDRIKLELDKLTIHELHNILQYVLNSGEWEFIDRYSYTKLSNDKYDELSTKYPEEFI